MFEKVARFFLIWCAWVLGLIALFIAAMSPELAVKFAIFAPFVALAVLAAGWFFVATAKLIAKCITLFVGGVESLGDQVVKAFTRGWHDES